MSTSIKAAIAGALSSNPELNTAIVEAIANITECHNGKAINGKYVEDPKPFYFFCGRYFDTLDAAKAAKDAELVEAERRAEAERKAANKAAYAAKYNKRAKK